jgi:hypothetical protein
MAAKRMNVYVVKIRFYLKDGEPYITRDIAVLGLTAKSARNKAEKMYHKRSKTILSVTRSRLSA